MDGHRPTITACELTAICLATQWAEHTEENNIVILSDCQEALNIVCSPSYSKFPSIKNTIISIWRRLEENGRSLKFTWIKAHAGVVGNEKADAAAKSALSKTPSISIRPTVADLHQIAATFITLQWQRRWNAATTSTDAFVRSHTPEVSHTATIYGKTRCDQVLLTRVRTNNLMLNQRLHHIRAHPNGLCGHCQSKEDVPHILLACPKYEEERREMFLTAPSTATELLALETETTRSAVLKFLKKTGIVRRLKLDASTHKTVKTRDSNISVSSV
jgi:ribonuclease HI